MGGWEREGEVAIKRKRQRRKRGSLEERMRGDRVRETDR